MRKNFLSNEEFVVEVKSLPIYEINTLSVFRARNTILTRFAMTRYVDAMLGS